jgi:thiamine phosphate synthase YjbQ (UPF0047 family)
VNESETGVFEDFAGLLARLGAAALDGADARSQALAMLLGPPGESIPVSNGDLCLGVWQRVLFLELDGGQGRDAGWHVHVIGS